MFNLKIGDQGGAVRTAQLALAAHGYAMHGTGYFGPNTRDAVKAFQVARGLPATGEIDAATSAALKETPAPQPKVETSAGVPPWAAKAISLVGIAEVAGNGDNPIILGWAKACGGMIAREYRHDAIPWCKMFTEYCLVSTGFRGIDSLWALDNLKVGTKLKGPAVGAIACKKRKGGGHTFIVVGKDKAGRIVGVGGNQGDRVSRATFAASEIVGYNWPDGYPLPEKVGLSSLPVVDSAPLSKREA